MWISVEYQIQTRTLTSNKELEKREIITQNIGKVLLIDDLGCGIEKFKQKVQKFNSSGNINLNDSIYNNMPPPDPDYSNEHELN